jgi:hypothetical protein
MLAFPADKKIYDANRGAVSFEGFDKSKRVVCRVSREALEDALQINGADEQAMINAYETLKNQIQAAAERLYREGVVEADGSVTVTTQVLNP